MRRKQGVQPSAATGHEQGSAHAAEPAATRIRLQPRHTGGLVSACVTGPAFCNRQQRMKVQHSRLLAAGSPAGWCPPEPLAPSLWPGGWRPCGCAAAPRCVTDKRKGIVGVRRTLSTAASRTGSSSSESATATSSADRVTVVAAAAAGAEAVAVRCIPLVGQRVQAAAHMKVTKPPV